jgi:C-terminal processing protease CtpA/Prc
LQRYANDYHLPVGEGLISILLSTSMQRVGFLSLLIYLLFVPAVFAQQTLTKQQERNLVAFAHLYGYVQYFHPSDEAQQVAWRMLAIKGSKQMLVARNDGELLQALTDLFQPLGPTIQLFPTSEHRQFDLAALQPPTAAGPGRAVSWQRQGLFTGDERFAPFFRKVRLNRLAEEESEFTFQQTGELGRYAGLPYEIELTISYQESEAPAFTFALAQRQFVGRPSGTEVATPRFQKQSLTPQAQRYTFRGTLDAKASSLEATLKFPVAFVQHTTIKTEVFVFLDGQKILLPQTPAGASGASARQTIELLVSSSNLLPEPLFSAQSQLGDYVHQELVPGLSCIVPLALAGDMAHTYPVGDSSRRQQLHVQPADWAKYPAEWQHYASDSVLTFPEIRLSNSIIAWNALRHGYAYWASASAQPDALLHQVLRQAYQDSSPAGFLRTLQRLLAPLNDGHAVATSSSAKLPAQRSVPLYFGKVGKQVVVTRVLDAGLAAQVKPGDVVRLLDGVAAAQVLQRQESLISGSPQRKTYQALLQLADGPAGQPLTLTLRRGHHTWRLPLPRTTTTTTYRAGSQVAAPRPTGWVAPGIYYYDLATTATPFQATDYDTLARAKAIIFDIRGAPTGLTALVSLLVRTPIEATLIYDLQMLRPDQVGLRYAPNVQRYTPGPQHLTSKLFFLTDAIVQSRMETFVELIRAFHLGTLVGQPTSGANGSINQLALQGGFYITYSGMRATNADGSRHHAVGIQPDVLVTPSLEAIQQGQDLILETALQLAQLAH